MAILITERGAVLDFKFE